MPPLKQLNQLFVSWVPLQRKRKEKPRKNPGPYTFEKTTAYEKKIQKGLRFKVKVPITL